MTPTSPTSRRRTRLVTLAWYASVACLSLVGPTVALELWRGKYYIPISYHGDGLLTMALLKGVATHGWWFSNPDLGAPLGQNLRDFPFASDSAALLLTRALALGSDNPGTLINLVFLAGFPICAMAMFALLRRVGSTSLTAATGALIFAWLPYHFVRSEGHLFLGTYWAVPAGIWLFLDAFDARRSSEKRSARSQVARVALCVVCATGGLYYAIFTCALVLAAVIVRAAGDLGSGARTLLARTATAWPAFLILGLTVLLMLPTILYRHAHGAGQAAQRIPSESETYGLSITSMLLPIFQHRIDALSKLTTKYFSLSPLQSEGSAAIGLAACVGVLVGAVALARVAARPRRSGDSRERVAAVAGLGILLCLLLATTGGLGALFAYLVDPQIRAWNRISIFIGGFALVALVASLDGLRRRASRSARPALNVVVALFVLALPVVALADQTTHAMVPDYATVEADYGSDEAFVSELDRRLPDGSLVLQLPYVPFPENPPVERMTDYDELRPYVHRGALKYSYGDMRGRGGDWKGLIGSRRPELLAWAAQTAGFSVVLIDRFGYNDDAAYLERILEPVLGEPFLASPNNRLVAYRLPAGDRGKAKEHRDLLERAPTIAFSGDLPPNSNLVSGGTLTSSAAIHVDDAAGTGTDRIRVHFAARTTSGRTALRVVTPDGRTRTFAVGSTPVEVDLVTRLDGNAGDLKLESDAPIQLEDLLVESEAIVEASNVLPPKGYTA